MAIQKIPLENLHNTRDLGGFVTKDGRKVKPYRLIRSGDLKDASENDKKVLTDRYGLNMIVDFRTALECKDRPDPEIPGVSYVWHPIFEEKKSGITREMDEENDFLEDFTQEALSCHMSAEDRMNMLYLQMVSSPHVRSQYSRFFDMLLAHEKGAILWHCSAGKDRVGMGTSLVLYALGVDKETIFEDYLMTNEFTKASVQAELAAVKERELVPDLEVLMTVRRRYIETVYDYLEKTYGTLDKSLEEGFGVTRQKRDRLREMYLEG